MRRCWQHCRDAPQAVVDAAAQAGLRCEYRGESAPVEVGVAVTRGDDGSQGTLFDDSEVPGAPGQPVPGQHSAPGQAAAESPDVGYRGPTACSAAGITYRQLDYWARTGLVEPSVRAATGSGSQRLYGFRDILVLRVVKSLLDTGISLQQIRAAVTVLREHGATDLAKITLM